MRDITKVGSIGLGTMGKPMAMNLLKAGRKVYGNDLFPEKAQDFVEAGGVLMDTAADVVREAAVIFTSVPSAANLQDILFGENGCVEGLTEQKIFADLNTISPAEARSFYQKLAEKGHRFLDTPVSGGQKGAIAGTLAIMVGGDEDAFETIKPLLDIIGSEPTYMGKAGTGQATKMANQLMLGINTAGVAEALMLGTREGVDLEKLLDVVKNGSGTSRQLISQGENMSKDHFPDKFPIKLIQKDFRLANQTMIEDNISLPLSSMVLQLYNAAASVQPMAGHEGIIIALEQLNGYHVGHYDKEP